MQEDREGLVGCYDDHLEQARTAFEQGEALRLLDAGSATPSQVAELVWALVASNLLLTESVEAGWARAAERCGSLGLRSLAGPLSEWSRAEEGRHREMLRDLERSQHRSRRAVAGGAIDQLLALQEETLGGSLPFGVVGMHHELWWGARRLSAVIAESGATTLARCVPFATAAPTAPSCRDLLALTLAERPDSLLELAAIGRRTSLAHGRLIDALWR